MTNTIKKTQAVLLLCLCFFFIAQASVAGNAPRTTLNMNTDWAFYRGDLPNGQLTDLDDSHWIPAVVPHVMQLEKKHCGGNSIYDGIGWYRRYFKLPKTDKGKRIVLDFEGVMTSCDVFLNGEKLTAHHGGYMGFSVDLSDKIRWEGNNVLAVRVSAQHDPLTPPGKPQGGMDFYYYSGIYRDVNLTVSDKLYITDALSEDLTAGGGIFITYPEVTEKQARVQVKTHLRNEHNVPQKGELLTQLLDKKGKVVASQTTSFVLNGQADTSLEQILTVKNPVLWSPYSPNLYILKTQVNVSGKTVDVRNTQTGIRTIHYTTDEGFFINGEKLFLRGANRHQAFPNIGDAASNSMQERDVINIKRGGFNAVRAAHYPHDPAFLDACDKYGLVVVECIPGWQYFNSDSIFINRLFDVGRNMIRRDRNHPSVILWEMALNESRYPVALAKALQEIAHAEYPGNQMYTVGDYFGNEDKEAYYDAFYKQVSKFPHDGNVMSNYPEDLIAVKPLFTREWGDGVGEKPRAGRIEGEYELMKQCRSHLRQLNGDGYFDWCMLDANPRMGGHFMWNFMDFARGCEDETEYCGGVDMDRYPKFLYYLMQSMRDRNISQVGLFEGAMIHIASYNDAPKDPSSTTDITVFSNCDKVKLYRNGKLLGVQTREEQRLACPYVVDKGGSPAFIFNAKNYEAGELKAEGLVNDQVIVTHSIRTPEAADHIEIVIHDEDIAPIADGSDMFPVYFKICDKNGTIVSHSSATIHITVEGEGVLIGKGVERIAIEHQQVEAGIGYALIRTSKHAGKITVAASSNGLAGAQANINSQPFKGTFVPDGIHSAFQGNEDDNVVIKPTTWEKSILSKPQIAIQQVEVTGSQALYPASNSIDGNDGTWWITDNDRLPQIITLTLQQTEFVSACRIFFQKDSSAYQHKIEVSSDGEKWETLYERESTGFDFKPVVINKKIHYLRVVVTAVSEGRAGIGEITLFGK
ncbi:MAG: Beta-galactosidase [Candidatus Ordinivivax streblomastigis]|uniref:Beta-galactosidase n=1 Tax=Candidatus Ordinivivax streblomastigis TaxID=2540710 RepID=A0A5M8P390_9BACT|nr:MAG: Beta-galactosidase [Candidatus Ordinivivax streblomastigis]